MIHLRKKDNEGNESLVRRFTRAFQSSGVVRETKSRQTFASPLTRPQLRRAAQIRRINRAKLAHAIKIGKVPPGTKSLKQKKRR
jgi:ribosomal protein S21